MNNCCKDYIVNTPITDFEKKTCKTCHRNKIGRISKKSVKEIKECFRRHTP